MAFFQNTRKPEGLGGKLMVTMMNHGHASLSAFGLQHIAIQENASCLDLGCGGGANVKKLLARSPQGHVTGLDYSEVSVAKSRKCNAAAIEAGRCEIVLGNVMTSPSLTTRSMWQPLLRPFISGPTWRKLLLKCSAS